MGGSKKQTVGYRYFAGMHMVLCHGPIDKITRIVVDEKELWAGSNTGGSITVDKRDLFGGDSREGGVSGTLDFMTGHGAQLPNDYLVSKLGSLVPAFRGVVSVVLRQMYLSMNPYLKTWGFTVQRIHVQQDGSAQWEDGYAQIDVTVYDAEGEPVSLAAMNPAHIIRECLTNKLWGMGYNDGDINDATFLSAAITLFNEKMGMALLWDTQTSIEEFVKIVLQHIDASLYVDRKTGQFVLKLIRGGYDEDDLIVLDPSNIDKIEDFKRPAFGELANSITVNYWDGSKDQTGSVTVQDIALAQEQGGENNTTVTYEGFIDPATASRVAQRDLKSLSTPLITCTIYTTKVARNLNIGDVFILSWPDYQIESVVMRITGIAYGDGKTRRVRIQCAQDVFSYPEDAFVTKPPSGWLDPIGPPGPVVVQKAFELPYFELVRDNGQSVVDSSLASNPYVGYIGAACSAPTVAAINALMHSDDGSGYEEVAQADFCAGAFLADDLDYMTTEFDLLSGSSLSLVDAGEWLQIGSELMAVVSLVGNTLTVKRGVLDTVPAQHTAGAEVLFWDGFAATDPTEYVASDSVAVKLTAANGSGVYPLASAVEMTVDVVGRAAKPFAPGRVQVNGSFYPVSDQSGDIVFTWVNRNRVFQTGGELIGFIDEEVSPEPGTTYRVVIEDSENSIFAVDDDLDALTYTVIGDDAATLYPFLYFNLSSKREGLYSFQSHRIKVNIVNPSIGVTGYEITISSGKVASDLSGFPLMVDLATMPVSFWAAVNSTGGNIRAFASDGVTGLPLDVTYIDVSLQSGRCFIKTDILSSADTTVVISLIEPEAVSLPATDSKGRNAVWSDYEFVTVFPETINRVNGSLPNIAGNSYRFDWKETAVANLTANQGVAFDGSYYYAVSTNYIRKYSSSGTLINSNSDPVGNVKTATGDTSLNHCGAPAIIDGELWVPVQQYPSSPYDQQYIAKFSLATSAFIGYTQLTGATRESSGFYYDATLNRLYVTDYTINDNIPYFDKTTGAFVGVLSLSSDIDNMQGMTELNGKYYVNSGGNRIYEVEKDGTNNGLVFFDTYTGDHEAVFAYGEELIVTKDNGFVRHYAKDLSRIDWARIHGSPIGYTVPKSTVWTTGVTWQETPALQQQGVIGVQALASPGTDRHSGMYDAPTSNGFGLWNTTNGWLYTSPRVFPVDYGKYRTVFAQNGTSGRKLTVNGTIKGSAGASSARPLDAGDMQFVIAGAANGENGYGYYQFAWGRADYMSDDWILADYENNMSPGTFYTVTEVF